MNTSEKEKRKELVKKVKALLEARTLKIIEETTDVLRCITYPTEIKKSWSFVAEVTFDSGRKEMFKVVFTDNDCPLMQDSIFYDIKVLDEW